MIIKRVYAENLYSYKKLDFEFNKFQGGTTLFLGKNLDQNTSNGAGKSTILKSLFFGIYGEDSEGARKGSVLRRGGNSSYYIITEFEDKGHNFKIERFEGRKDLIHGGRGLNFYIDDVLFNGDGIEATQKIIQSKIKISSRLFMSSIFSQQGEKSFLVESDTNKKELLTELLDLGVYQKAHVYVKDKIKEKKEEISILENKKNNLNEQISTLDKEVQELVKEKNLFKDKLKEEYLKERALFLEIRNKLDEINKSKKKYDLNSLISNKRELELELKEVSENLLLINNEIKELFKSKTDYGIVQNSLQSKRDELEKINKEINLLEEKIFEEDALNKFIEELKSLDFKIKEIKDRSSLIDKVSQEIKDINRDIKELDRSKGQLEKEITSLEEDKSCPTCKREYDNSHKEHVLKSKKEKEDSLKSIQNSISLLRKEVLSKEETIDLNKKEIEKEDLSSLEERKEKVNIDKIKEESKKEDTEKHNSKKKDLLIEAQKITEIISSLELDIKKLEKDIEVITAKEKEKSLLDQKAQKYSEGMKKLDEDISEAKIEEEKFKNIEMTKFELSESLEQKKAKIIEIKGRENPFGVLIERLEKRASGFLTRIQSHDKEINKINEDLKYYNFWNIGFAPTGIRSFITDDIIDLLNQKTQDNLNDLFDGAISILFDPESKNNKGVVSNKISTTFFLNGKEAEFATLSSGEKRRAILATDLAITEIAESRSGSKMNIRFLDEPFNGIDSNGQMKAFRLFSRLSKDKDGFFIISHDETFQNMCQNVVYILKKNEVSSIVDRETFNKFDITTGSNSSKEEDVQNKEAKGSGLAERLQALAKERAEKGK